MEQTLTPTQAEEKVQPKKNYNQLRRQRVNPSNRNDAYIRMNAELDSLVDESSKIVELGFLKRRVLVDLDTDTSGWFIKPQGTYIEVNKRIIVSFKKYTFVNACRLLMQVTDPMLRVDHINHNRLDNRLKNLRVCTHAENMRNKQSYSLTTSYKGLNGTDTPHAYRIQLQTEGLRMTLDLSMETQADLFSRIYDCLAIKYYGAYACLNRSHDDYDSAMVDGVFNLVEDYINVFDRNKVPENF